MSIPASTNLSRFLLILVSIILSAISGCSIHRPYLSGEVTSRVKNDTLIIKYDIHIKNPAIDSVAFQLLPTDDSKGRVSYDVYYASEERVKDSVYRSLGDSLPCCIDLPFQMLRAIRKGTAVGTASRLDTNSLCWWNTLSSPKTDSILESINPNIFCLLCYKLLVDSVLKVASLDGLRKISVPCGWRYRASSGPESHIDTILQADSVIFGRDPKVIDRCFGRVQESNSSAVSMQGQLRYPVNGYQEPVQYALKYYAMNDNDTIAPFRNDLSDGRYARQKVWGGVIPPRPKTEVYRFAESGNMLGMLGGIGGAKNDIFALPSRPAITEPNYGFSLAWGVMYYTPHFIHTLEWELLNGASSNESEGATNLNSVLLATRYHSRRAVSRGPLFTAGFGFSDLSMNHDKVELAGDEAFDLRVGAGYETSFDRIEYAYHTAHGGYHRFDLLVGIAALTQGKAGLKWSLLTGDRVRTSALELYMENRFFSETMRNLCNSRPLIVQAALYAGIIAGWVALF